MRFTLFSMLYTLRQNVLIRISPYPTTTQINDDCFDYVIDTSFDNCTLQKQYCPKDDDATVVALNTTLEECNTLFNVFDLEDWAAGLLLLIISLLTMILSLLFMVKILNTLLKGKKRLRRGQLLFWRARICLRTFYSFVN